MEKKSKMSLIIILIILIIIIIALITVIAINKKKNIKVAEQNYVSTNIQTNTANSSGVLNEISKNNETSLLTQNNVENLSQEELKYFTEYFRKNQNNIFIKSTYSNVQNMDLNIALYNGIDEEQELGNEEKQELEKSIGHEINTDVVKLTTTQIKKFFEEKTGKEMDNISAKLTNFTYLNKYDAYYAEHGDTNYRTIDCVSGQKTSDGKYIISYENAIKDEISNFSTGTITLQKQNDKYLVVSNTIIK